MTYVLGRRLFFIEGASKLKWDPSFVVNEKKLIKTCQQYPQYFPSNKISDILPLLEKYLKSKILPFKFFQNGCLKFQDILIRSYDRFVTYVVGGVIIGARLGYVFFYGWPQFKAHPGDIWKIWEGGLASHGACMGLLIALGLVVYRRSQKMLQFTYLQLLDIMAILSGFMAFFIRMGNFVNQEIVGIPSKMPWAIIFKNPLSQEQTVPRHPVQLYEGLFYLFIGCLIWRLWEKKRFEIGQGQLTGLLLTCLFTFRLGIEFLKEHQGIVVSSTSFLQMGQILSLPFIAIGIALLLRPLFLKRRQYKRFQP